MAGEDGGEEDPYAVLGVPRTASSDAIRRAYRQLAGATHPDRHSSAAMREAASAAFHRVQRAYELLGDERTRAVFDTYGLQGVRAGLQLSAQPNSQPPSWETLAQAQTKQKQRRMEAKLNSRGSYMLGFSAAGLLDEDGGVGLHNMAMSSTTSFPLRADSDGMLGNDSGYIGAQAASKMGFGSGNLLLGLKHHESDGTSGELNASCGMRNSLSLSSWRPLTKHLTGSITHSLSQQDGYGLALLFSHDITQSVSSHLQWSLAPGVGMSTGLSYSGEATQASGELKMGALGTGVSAQCVRQVGTGRTVRMSGKAGTMGVEAEVGGMQRIGELTSLGASLQSGLVGIYAKLKLTRGGQRFVLPVLLSPVFRLRTTLAAAIVPPLIGYAANEFVLLPLLERRRRRADLEARKRRAEEIRKAKDDARSTQAMLRPQSERKLKAEERDQHGLVIETAVYGVLSESGFPSDGLEETCRSGKEDGDEKASDNTDAELLLPEPYIGVTVPLQVLVESHQVTLERDTALPDILGFCDPAPGSRNKRLRVQYRHEGRRHEVEAGEGEGLRIPDLRHRVD